MTSAPSLQFSDTLRVDGEVTLVKPACQFEVLLSETVLAGPRRDDALALLGVLSHEYPRIWVGVLGHLPRTHWVFKASGMLEITLALLADTDMTALNAAYRGKQSATDVLSFPGLEADEALESGLLGLPSLALGEVDVSLDWAFAHFKAESNSGNPQRAFVLYVLERVIHGTLHVLGVHHDTLSAYNKVIRIQADILSTLLL